MSLNDNFDRHVIMCLFMYAVILLYITDNKLKLFHNYDLIVDWRFTQYNCNKSKSQ